MRNKKGLALSLSKGFTLIELLVVISIMAILATIAVTVFSGAQGSARDGKRVSEINSIAKSIESSKNYVTGLYTYNATTFADDFPKNAPSDSLYCITTRASTGSPFASPTVPAAYPVDASGVTICPTITTPAAVALVTATFTSGTFSASYASGGGLALGTANSWTLCAKLERTTTPYCVSSLTK